MRIATYNVEWFDALFDDDGALLVDDVITARRKLPRRQQITALAQVFRAMDADAVMVIEAPDTSARRSSTRALSRFAEEFGLRTSAVVTGFTNDTQQEIALMYDPAVLSVTHDPGAGPDAPRFDDVFAIDLDVDAAPDAVRFSKPPLELQAKTVDGAEFRMIGAHLKSKAPHGAKSPEDVLRLSIANRRKQLAQAVWLRRRIDSLLEAGEEVIVLGDLNDGPGLDEFEHLFGKSSVEIILGQPPHALYDPHASRALVSRISAQPTTARFYLEHEQRYLQALLDYIMVSDGLRRRHMPRWRIWHPFDDPQCWQDDALRKALLDASDHFPVTLDLSI
ncbi:endonuclease/exonuclease/phosphatase family protein [Sagittula sp. SSi028]|uniref:endonuclease/exonuclease/phosphatase family protein n=1 Tax=Sagittula sp. SSi028 TaxID=3400636 RepID=UPI003AF71A58